MGNDGSCWHEEAGEEKAQVVLLCFLGRDRLLLYILHKAEENRLTFLVRCLYLHTVHSITEMKVNDHFRAVLS